MISKELTHILLKEAGRKLFELSESDNWQYISEKLSDITKMLDALAEEFSTGNKNKDITK